MIWAYNGGSTERGTVHVQDWNYTNSVCYLNGCYDQNYSPFGTFSIPSVPCTGKSCSLLIATVVQVAIDRMEHSVLDMIYLKWLDCN